jgi:hypothetical protein
MNSQEIDGIINIVSLRKLPYSYNDNFECVINLAIMEDPTIINVCGHTFDR